MDLSRFPRRHYTNCKTPIEFLPHFTKEIGGPNIYIKRDDLLGLTAGGNKTRKLEFLVADAIRNNADTLITCGAVQSNHCRLTLSAAVKEGLKCRLVLEERVANSYNPEASGNNLIYRLLGVENVEVVPGGTNMLQAMEKVNSDLKEEGRVGYIIPGGGSNEIGATGYVACAQEIQEQLFEYGLNMDRVVVASGSSGTHAGLVTGFYGCNMHLPVIGINVSRDSEDQDTIVYNLVNKLINHLNIKQEIPRNAVNTFGDYWRPKYSVPNKKMVEAVNLLACTEGILLDPVYTGKAMAGFIDLCRKGFFDKNENIMFVHTGGSPANHVYSKTLLGLEEPAE